MLKGRIVLIPFPFTDLTGQKVRPALVLHVSRGEDCIVAFISTRIEKRNPYDIRVSPSSTNGLKVESVVKVDKLATLQKKIVIGELGVLERQNLHIVDVALRKLFKI
ncbi:MAG: hypothetical protein UY67_C0001G0049 [Candidatus Kaiserbacteria bacterium GW2011_GWA2_52_12]|uniref:Transcriptional modulator of MazE/toxin, MazF n=1 Tax=Candidatus Kaiserbacteria bacterium GW2011_GWA2_52_12 TaxID=1618671 RepID=A0A0G1ZBC9_9BACT|nr:MAG: hypothetical protein UY67_C0001G0049 [Candidatus Kaiserbacteria bacterium GW2011_GWA2_52_12]